MGKLSVTILSVVSMVSAAAPVSSLIYGTRLDPAELMAHPLTSRDSCAATYDYVFGSVGKGGEDVVLSHSCLPDPCDDANAPALARLLGIDIRPADWEFYKARFGAMCDPSDAPDMAARSESLPFGVSSPLGDGNGLLTPGTLVPGANELIEATKPPETTGPDVVDGGTPSPQTPPNTPVIPTLPPDWTPPFVPTPGGGDDGGTDDGDDGGTDGDDGNTNDGLTPPAPVVPLPSGSILLLSALAAVGLGRRRKS